MKYRNLFASASVLALLASPAYALDIDLGDADGDATTAEIVTPVALAEESVYMMGDAELDGEYELTVSSTGTFAAAQNYLLTVELIGGTFSENLDGSEVTDGDSTANGVNVNGSSVQQGSGGGLSGREGDSTVTFLFSTDPDPTAGSGDNFGLELPISFDGCPADLDIKITLRTSEGIPFEEGMVSLTDDGDAPAVGCVNAFQASVLDDRLYEDPGDDFDTVLTSASSFSQFNTDVDAPDTDSPADGTMALSTLDQSDLGSVGTALAVFNPTGETRPIVARLDDVSAPLDGSEADTIDFDVVIVDDAGIENAELDEQGTEETFTTLVASYEGVDVGDLSLGDFIENVAIEVDGSTQVTPQRPDSDNVVLNFSDPDLVESEMGTDGPLDDLNFEGVLCGTFDWVGDATKPTRNVFRFTQFGDEVSLVQAIFMNSNIVADGTTVDLAVPASKLSSEEFTLNQNDLSAAAGNFNRADVMFNLVGAEETLDCDRLLASPSNAAVSDFGNDGIGRIFGADDGFEDGDDIQEGAESGSTNISTNL